MTQSNEIDDDLQSLLDQLDEDELPSTPEEVAEEVAEEIEEITSADPSGNGSPIDDEVAALQPGDELVPTDIRKIKSEELQLITGTNGPGSEAIDDLLIDVSKYLEQLDGVTQEVLQACRSDRQEVQDVINEMRRQIDNANLGDPDQIPHYR